MFDHNRYYAPFKSKKVIIQQSLFYHCNYAFVDCNGIFSSDPLLNIVRQIMPGGHFFDVEKCPPPPFGH